VSWRRLAVFLAIASAMLTGCESIPGETTATVPAPVDVPSRSMSNDRKTAELAEGFPFQIPVYDGVVLGNQEVVPGSVWGYDLGAPEPAEIVAEWYRRAYAGANWVLEREETVEGEDWSGVALYLSKGAGAQSVITVRTEGDGRTTVSATVGLGAGIGDTF
jgi:hypothetical protein